MAGRGKSRSQNTGAVAGSSLPAPPAYAQATPGGRGGRDRNDESAGRSSELPNPGNRRPGTSREGRGTAAGGSFRSGSGTAAPVTNQHGERVDTSRGGLVSGSSSRRVVHRVGMDCLSPINVTRDGPSSSQGGWVCTCSEATNPLQHYSSIATDRILRTTEEKYWLEIHLARNQISYTSTSS